MSATFSEELAAQGSPMESLALAMRQMVLEEAPNAMETPYAVTNAVSIGYSFTGRAVDLFVHIAAYESWVNLGFNEGASLADPGCILRGEGLKIRFIRISSLADLERPFVRRFVQQAATAAKKPVAVDLGKAVQVLAERKRKRRS
ncbi:MAG: hypothetical protein JNM66_28125 [Bryobacterales bacterium]|nr:hypothetical protein [Bryobacterales bacterium]